MQIRRWFYILQILEKRPKTTFRIHHELEQLRIYVCLRTVERDLDAISSIFMGIYSERSERQVFWRLDGLPNNIAQLKLKSHWENKVTSAGMASSNESEYKKVA